MNYSEFLKELAEDLKEKLQSRNRNVEVEIVDVEKPWEWKIGLRISEGKRLCPVLYVDEQYEYYKAGMNYQMIVAYMTHKIEKALDKVPEKINLNFRDFRDTVTMQLLNTDRCEGYLKGKVCREVEDLSIIYRFNFDMGKGNHYSTVVSKHMLELMQLTEEELHQFAMIRAPFNKPYVIKPLAAMIEELTGEAVTMQTQMDSPMMILSNEDMHFGASVIFYPDVLNECSNAMNGDYYIIPSSIHECLLYPDNGDLTLKELKSMVEDVNNTILDPRELLSYNVYHYDHKEKIFELGEKYEARIAAKSSVLDNLKDKQRVLKECGHLVRTQDVGGRLGREQSL